MGPHDSSKPPQSVTGSGDRTDATRALLRHRYRRYVVRRVRRADRPILLERLAIEIAAREREMPEAEVPLETADRICSALRRTHLPKLATESIVEYDDSTGTVAPAEASIDPEPWIGGGEKDD